MAEESLSEPTSRMNLQETDEEDAQEDTGSGDMITFNVASKGGKNTRTKQIINNRRISKNVNILCVEANSDDTIEEALKRDGRFADIVFQSGCTLQSCDEKHEISISKKVRALEGHFYKICLPRKNSSNMPDFEKIYDDLHSQFPEFPEECLQLTNEDFEQRTGSFSTNDDQQLVNLGTSVCMVNIEKSQGTGFLLFDNFILTNAHVIEKSYNIHSKTLKGAPSLNFNMGSGTALEFPLCSDVFAFLKGRDDAGRYVDFALLKLKNSEEITTNEDITNLPRLLKEYTSTQPDGGIHLIGHPGTDVKIINVSCIVPHTETRSASGDSIQVSLITRSLIDDVPSEHKIKGFNIDTYSTYFLKGSSGSPVFDKNCKLVAMHTGGFLADETREHAIGFAIPLQSIIKNIIKQLASREDLDAMFKFIETAAQNPARNPDLEEYLKECAQEMKRNLTRNTKILAKICLETRNGMPNLSQMIYEALNTNIEQTQQEIDTYTAHQEEE